MNKAKRGYWLIPVITIVLGGCGPRATATELALIETPETIPITSSGPAMEVGSTFLYADGAMLAAVPGGTFTMGGNVPDNPEHQVNLKDFWIYSTKVTNAQYAYCVEMGVCTPLQFKAHNPDYDDPLHGNDPMVGVDYTQAAGYCQFVHARLPTEAEWEKAARGPEGNTYPWGEDKPNCDLLNYDVCVGRTTPVTTYPEGRSYYQVFDMEGNAFEWVADRYQADYFINAPADNPKGPDKGLQRVVRSSAYNSGANQTQAYNRFHSSPDTVRDNLGFRCAVDDPSYFAPYCNFPAVYGTDGIGGASTGFGIKVVCPELEIIQNPTCEGTMPVTNFDFIVDTTNLNEKVPGGWGYTWSNQNGCNIDTNTKQLQCTENGEVRVCGICQANITAPPQCPVGYSYNTNAKICMGIGSSGVCLPGYTATTSSTGTCCNLVGGTSAPTALPLNMGSLGVYSIDTFPYCPAGTYYIYNPSSNAPECIAVPAQYPYCITEGIALNSCMPGGGGGDGQPQGCPPQSCDTNYSWDSSSCSCVCDGC